MKKILVLAEKPSVGKDLARVLECRQNGSGCMIGERYIVTWALGHLVTLAEPEAYSNQYKKWNLEDLPMLPEKMKLVVIGQTAKQFRIVADLMKRPDISSLIIATDSGREGELVARWIMEKAGFRKPAQRLWISSQTDKAIREGFANLKPAKAYDNLYRSAQARAQADWLVGINVTRALTCKYNAQLSAGRVQTPTLSLIVDRENEIKRFVPKNFWTVQADFGSNRAFFRDRNGQEQIFDERKASAIAAAITGKTAIITEINRTSKRQNPPAAYDLTELQRDANKKYAYSAKQTLSIMQSLYERHKILTYPRTDSRYITDDIVPTIPERLQSIAVGAYAPFAQELYRNRSYSTRFLVNNAKVTDHHAIIPTEQAVDLSALTSEERNVYDLVVRRFLAVLSPPYEYDNVKIKYDAEGFQFYTGGQLARNAGWKKIYGNYYLDDDNNKDEFEFTADIHQGCHVKIMAPKVKPGKTSPPPRYTTATLLTAMEHPGKQVDDKTLRDVLETTSGLGTPATRADIIEKLFDAFYVELHGKEICPTSKGMQLAELVPEDLKSAVLTARWEQQLDKISKGESIDSHFISGMRKYASKLVANVIASDATYVHDNITREKCPNCGKFLLAVKGKRGQMLVCPDRECGYRKSIAVQTNARCPNCHKKLELRGEGEKKIFACACGFREKLSDFEKKKQNKGMSKREVQKYLNNQKSEHPSSSALADQLAKWLEQNQS